MYKQAHGSGRFKLNRGRISIAVPWALVLDYYHRHGAIMLSKDTTSMAITVSISLCTVYCIIDRKVNTIPLEKLQCHRSGAAGAAQATTLFVPYFCSRCTLIS